MSGACCTPEIPCTISSLSSQDLHADHRPRFNGDLKVTVNNGLEITVPNHQLVQYFYTYDGNGDPIVNGSVRELMINPLEQIK